MYKLGFLMSIRADDAGPFHSVGMSAVAEQRAKQLEAIRPQTHTQGE